MDVQIDGNKVEVKFGPKDPDTLPGIVHQALGYLCTDSAKICLVDGGIEATVAADTTPASVRRFIELAIAPKTT